MQLLRNHPYRVGLACVLVVAAAAYVFTPLPKDAARYVWRRWHAPQLALLLDRSDSALAMEIGNEYFGSLIIGETVHQYNPALAARAFHTALAIQPGILYGHYSLARIAFAKGDFEAALKEIDAELAANPMNLRSLYIRGLIYGYRDKPGDLANAEQDFRTFNKWLPSDWAGYNDLAWILGKEGKYKDMAAVAQAGIHTVADGDANPWLWNEFGVAKLDLGDQTEAHTAFENALSHATDLTTSDWRVAYSGDSPATDVAGLTAFITAIEENLASTTAQATASR